MYDVFEYEPKNDAFELFEKENKNRFEECKQRYGRVQNQNENENEANRRESNFYAVDT